MEKKKKIKPQRPRGFEDLSGSSLSELLQLRDSIQKVYSLYGFEPLETGIIEYSDVIGSFLPDQDRPNEGVFSFEDARLPDLLFRYRARNFPDSLSAEEREEWLQFCRDKCLSGEHGRLDKELDNIDRLLKIHPERSEVLNELTDFLKEKKQLLS